jgi:ABC-type transport system substrate-binding protein
VDRALRLAAALAALVLPAGALAETRPQTGGNIVAPLFEQPVAPGDPMRAIRWSDQVVAAATAEGLYRDGQPALAEGEPQPVSPLALRIRLAAGLKTHDGRAVGAAEVAAAIERARADRRLAFLLGPIASAQAVGPDVVQLTLSRPAAAGELVTVLSAPQLAVPRTGPFVLAHTSADALRLDAFPGYHGGRPYLDRVTLRAFGSRREEVTAFELGRAQVSLRGAAVFAAQTGAPLLSAPRLDPTALRTFLGFSPQAKPEARQAVALTIDREAVRRFAAAEPSWTLPGPPLGAAQAGPLFSAAGWRGHTLTLLVDRSRFEDEDVAQKVQSQLANAGVMVRIESVPAAEFERRVAAGKDLDLYVGLCAPPSPDPQIAAAWIARCGADAEPLFARGLRVHRAPELRGLRFDGVGRIRFEDAFLWRPAAAARTGSP